MSLTRALSLLAVLVVSCAANANTAPIAPSADIFSAGQTVVPSDGTAAPVFAVSSVLPSVLHVTSVTGSIFSGCAPASGPDGGNPCTQAATTIDAGNGLSGVHTAGAFFLAGVFLSDDAPITPAPATLDFTDDRLGKSFDSLSPELAQIFFIGDGRTDGGDLQNFFVPTGATRLLLGTIDNCGGWQRNET